MLLTFYVTNTYLATPLDLMHCIRANLHPLLSCSAAGLMRYWMALRCPNVPVPGDVGPERCADSVALCTACAS